MQWLNNKITFLFFFVFIGRDFFLPGRHTHTHRKEWKKKFRHGGFYFCACASVRVLVQSVAWVEYRVRIPNPSDLIYLFLFFFVLFVVVFARFLLHVETLQVIFIIIIHFDPIPPSKIIGRSLPFIYLNFYQKLCPQPPPPLHSHTVN